MNNNLEFENEDPSPDSIEDNHPRTNYGAGYSNISPLKGDTSNREDEWDKAIEKFNQTHYEDGGLMLIDWLKTNYNIQKK